MCQVSLPICGHSDYVEINKVEFVEKEMNEKERAREKRIQLKTTTDLIRVNFKFSDIWLC